MYDVALNRKRGYDDNGDGADAVQGGDQRTHEDVESVSMPMDHFIACMVWSGTGEER